MLCYRTRRARGQRQGRVDIKERKHQLSWRCIMDRRFLCVMIASAGLAGWFLVSPQARTDENQNPSGEQPGVEVMARGPVHEAFAEPSIRGPRPTPIVPNKRPDAIDEVPPDQRPPDENAS